MIKILAQRKPWFPTLFELIVKKGNDETKG